MKTTTIVAASVVLGLSTWAVIEQAHAHGDSHKETVEEAHPEEEEVAMDAFSGTGEIIDITCYLRHDSKGSEHVKCAVYCAGLGMPLGFLEDGTKNIHLIVPSGHGDPKEAVVGNMGEQVKIEGLVYSAGGLNTLEVTQISAVEK